MVLLEEIMKQNIALIFLVCLLALPYQAVGSDIDSRMKTLEETLNKQQKVIEDQQKLIREMKEELQTFKELNKTEHVTKAESLKAAEVREQKPSGLTGLFGGSILTNPYISLVLMASTIHRTFLSGNWKTGGYRAIQSLVSNPRKDSTSNQQNFFFLHRLTRISTFMPRFP
jgi:uncharacterized coiled-coil protein SlyX